MRRTIMNWVIVILLVSGSSAMACDLVVVDAWLRPAPPTAQMRAAYVTVRNDGVETCRLTGAASDSFRSVTIHRTTLIDGVATMRPILTSLIDPGQTLTMEPGGIHLMLMGRPADARAPVLIKLLLGDDPWIETELRLEVSP